MFSHVLRVTGILAVAAVLPCDGQLSNADKVRDLVEIANRFQVNYADPDWKAQQFGANLFDLSPWTARVQQTASDLEYLDVLTQYVSQLNDAHVSIRWPLPFQGYLGFSADLYDGKALIDTIYRTLLPAGAFPFQTGDELVSVEVVVRRANGAVETYTVPWFKTGAPVEKLRPCGGLTGLDSKGVRAAGSGSPEMGMARLPDERTANIANMGVQTPLFQAPPTFVTRLGAWSAFTGVNSPYFFSGIWTANGLRIGYIRIPNFSPADQNAALAQFQQEMQDFRQMTDGLVVDVMHNPGGMVQYAEALAQALIPGEFQTMGFEVRPSLDWIQFFSNELQNAITLNVPGSQIASLQDELAQVMAAYATGAQRTGPLSLNGTGALWLNGSPGAYDKPMVVLTDEFSASAAEMFAAVLQDNGRAAVAGMRSMGAGGTVEDMDAGSCAEGTLSVTVSLMRRPVQVIPPDLPPTNYVENVGVLPDVQVDYMTAANLTQWGAPFVDQITAVIVQQIQAGP